MTELRITIPIRTVSELNQREHWAKTHKRRSSQRESVAWMLNGKTPPQPPADVFLTRIAPRSLDCDNLAASFKACRDQVAEWLGVDDADPRVKWHYDQRRGDAGQYAVEIEILSDKG